MTLSLKPFKTKQLPKVQSKITSKKLHSTCTLIQQCVAPDLLSIHNTNYRPSVTLTFTSDTGWYRTEHSPVSSCLLFFLSETEDNVSPKAPLNSMQAPAHTYWHEVLCKSSRCIVGKRLNSGSALVQSQPLDSGA